MRSWFRMVTAISAMCLLAACGFALRGVTPLPFESMYLGVNTNSAFGASLKRAIHAASPATVLTEIPKEAETLYTQIRNDRGLREVSLNVVGRVEQYELTVTYTFRVTDLKGNAILPDTTLAASREVPFDDQFLQAKDQEFQHIYEDLEQGLVARIVRRLTAPDVVTAYRALQEGRVIENGPDPITPDLTPRQDNAPDAWRREQVGPSGIRR